MRSSMGRPERSTTPQMPHILTYPQGFAIELRDDCPSEILGWDHLANCTNSRQPFFKVTPLVVAPHRDTEPIEPVSPTDLEREVGIKAYVRRDDSVPQTGSQNRASQKYCPDQGKVDGRKRECRPVTGPMRKPLGQAAQDFYQDVGQPALGTIDPHHNPPTTTDASSQCLKASKGVWQVVQHADRAHNMEGPF